MTAMLTRFSTPKSSPSSFASYTPLVEETSHSLGFEAGDKNIRRYVGNSPMIATDPTGLKINAGQLPTTPPTPPFLTAEEHLQNVVDQITTKISSYYDNAFFKAEDIFKGSPDPVNVELSVSVRLSTVSIISKEVPPNLGLGVIDLQQNIERAVFPKVSVPLAQKASFERADLDESWIPQAPIRTVTPYVWGIPVPRDVNSFFANKMFPGVGVADLVQFLTDETQVNVRISATVSITVVPFKKNNC